LFTILNAESLAAEPSAKPSLSVTTTSPVVSKIAATITANGSIAAWQDASIGAEVGGLRMAEVLVNVGDKVKRGQLLAAFSTDTVKADLAVMKAQESEASAALGDARANAARARGLKDSGALSSQQINQYLTAEQTAKAKLEAAKAQVAVQELRLRNTEVRAPDDGVISMRQATIGAVVPAGTELFKMVRQARLEWRADVTAEELGRLKIGIPVAVYPASLTKGMPPVEGKVRIIGPTVDPQARTAIVYVDLFSPVNDEPPLRAGMFASGKFDLGTTTGLTLPQESVVMRDGFSYVFKIGDDSRVVQLRVSLGRRFDRRVEILEGVSAEDVVVESGAGFLTNGDLVAVTKREAPPEPTGKTNPATSPKTQ
jgi:RND family efflux transporter MFP subunit